MARLATLLILLGTATSASAQSSYVGVSVLGDISRFSRVGSTEENGPLSIFPADTPGDAETLGVGFTLGTAIADRWGLELEIVRPAESVQSATLRLPPIRIDPRLAFPIPAFEVTLETAQRHTTMAALAWARQEIGERLELAYLGGITFSRAEQTRRYRLADSRLLPLLTALAPGTTTIEYAAGPVIGVDARWMLGDHVSVVPGMRLHSVAVAGRRGWLLRPAVGVRWRF